MTLPLELHDGDTVRYEIALPFLPPSKNVYDSWPGTWKSAAKKKWVKHVTAACIEAGVPPGQHRIGLSAVLVFPTKARRDVSNYAQALWHWVPDALQDCGVLLDDRDGAILYGPNLSIRMEVDGRTTIDKRKRQRTILTVEVEER